MGLGTRPCVGLEVSAPSEFACVNEVAQRVATGDPLNWPAGQPHLHVRGGGVMPDPNGLLWATGGDEHGYDAVWQEAIRTDPVLRLFLRVRDLEVAGGPGVESRTGPVVRSGHGNRASLFEPDRVRTHLRQGNAQSQHALLNVCLPLHYKHHFTHAACVDGSMVDPRREGGAGVKKVSYGVWEGVRPEAEVQPGYLPDHERLRLCACWGPPTMRQ